MGKQSDKKAEIKHKGDRQIYLYVTFICSIVHIGFLLYQSQLFETPSLLLFGFFSFVNYFTFKGIDKSLAMGLSIKSYEYWFDLFAINNLVEATCKISNYFWIFYLLIPGYFGFYILKYIWGYLSTPHYEQSPDQNQSAKQKKKKDKDKVKVKYIK